MVKARSMFTLLLKNKKSTQDFCEPDLLISQTCQSIYHKYKRGGPEEGKSNRVGNRQSNGEGNSNNRGLNKARPDFVCHFVRPRTSMSKAFSLVEMLVALSITSLLLVSVSSFVRASGLGVRKISGDWGLSRDVFSAKELIERHLKSASHIFGVPVYFLASSKEEKSLLLGAKVGTLQPESSVLSIVRYSDYILRRISDVERATSELPEVLGSYCAVKLSSESFSADFPVFAPKEVSLALLASRYSFSPYRISLIEELDVSTSVCGKLFGATALKLALPSLEKYTSIGILRSNFFAREMLMSSHPEFGEDPVVSIYPITEIFILYLDSRGVLRQRSFPESGDQPVQNGLDLFLVQELDSNLLNLCLERKGSRSCSKITLLRQQVEVSDGI